MCLLLLPGCQRWQFGNLSDVLQPSNRRDWQPLLATLPTAEFDGDQVRVRNIRNCRYVTANDYVLQYYDRVFAWDEVQSVDFVVVPFKQTPVLAHTMLSFGFADGTYLGVSVEVRNEKGEQYNLLGGIGRQFELTYVLADERDLIGLRTEHRDAEVYVFPSVATPEQARALLADILKRVNQLASDPEFYGAILNNCTTNLAAHVNNLSPDRIAYGWRVLLPGFSAKYAYDLGLIDNSIPFEDLTALAYVNDLVEKHFDDPNFSQLIRSKRKLASASVRRQQARSSTFDGRGEEYLALRGQPRRR
jgi:hypothetical protein